MAQLRNCVLFRSRSGAILEVRNGVLHTKNIEKFYTYRTAIVQATVWIEIEGHVMWEMLNRYLERRGYHIDNHICWKLDNGMYFMYSDRKLGIGLDIVEQSW